MVSLGDKNPIAVEKNKLLLPPNFNRYFMWGFPDYSARIATVEGDKVRSHLRTYVWMCITYINTCMYNKVYSGNLGG